MRLKKYEKISLITILSILIIIISISFIVLLFIKKEMCYLKLNGVVYNKNIVVILVDKNDKKIIYKNNCLYIENIKYKYKIEEEQEIKKNKLYELKLSFKFKDNYNQNDLVRITIMKNKESIINIMKKIWKG